MNNNISLFDQGYALGFAQKPYLFPYDETTADDISRKDFASGYNIGKEDKEDFIKGQAIVTMLNLTPVKTDGEGRNFYSTLWGDKTEIGLARSVKRVIEDGKV